MTSPPTEPTSDQAIPADREQHTGAPESRLSGGSWASGPSSAGSSAMHRTAAQDVTSGDPARLAALESVQRRWTHDKHAGVLPPSADAIEAQRALLLGARH